MTILSSQEAEICNYADFTTIYIHDSDINTLILANGKVVSKKKICVSISERQRLWYLGTILIPDSSLVNGLVVYARKV